MNSITRKQAHPIPNVDSLLDKFRNARYLTKIDMKNAFFQIEISLAIEGRGQFRFTRLPFGLANRPSCFQETMDEFIRSSPEGAKRFVATYIDNICIITDNFQDHVK